MSFFTRLKRQIPNDTRVTIPAHQFYATLVAYIDGIVDRAKIERVWEITDAKEKQDLTFILSAIDSARDKRKVANVIHCIYILSDWEHRYKESWILSETDIKAWITAAST